MINFTDALAAARRKALLTGQPLTNNELTGIKTGWFDNAKVVSARDRAQQLAEKQQADAKRQQEDQLEQQKLEQQGMVDAAAKTQTNQTIGNTVKGIGQELGMDYIKSGPGESLIAKGAGAVKNLFAPGAGEGVGTGIGTLSEGLAEPAADLTMQGVNSLSTANAAASATPQVAGTLGVETGISATPNIAAPVVTETAGAGLGSTLGTIGSTIGNVVSIAAPYYAAAKLGGMAVNAFTKNNPKYKETPLGWLGEGLEAPLTGVESSVGEIAARHGWGTVKDNERLAKIFNPGRAIAEAFGIKGCIIVTACTDRDSYEVNITRQYRDKFLSQSSLRGYYCLAEKIVPILKRNDALRRTVKTWLVDRLVDYGEYRLGLKKKRPRLLSYAVATAFLATIKVIGSIIPQYVRLNGELI